jgi:cleavage and polyadenylation specificity factor subunit 2
LQLPLRCSFLYVDIEGRSDGRSLHTVIRDLHPRKLIIISGSPEGKESLKETCKTMGACNDVVLPKENQSVSVTSESNLYRINLKDSLVKQLQFIEVSEDYEIAYLEGEIKLNFSESSLPILNQKTKEHTGHPAVFLGHVKPHELQMILQNDGIECELVSGVLVCAGGLVNIIKVNEFQISIQGSICEEYYRIRELLYLQYQIV